MKKKLENSGDEAASEQQEVADYVVGLVSGSLFQQKKKKKKKKQEESESAAAGSSLSSLFSSATAAVATATTTSLLFQPAPKLEVQKSEEKQQDETPEVKGQTGQKKKTTKVKTAGEEKLENRESALQEADEDERGQETKTAAAKRKRKAAAMESSSGEKEAELWVMKRQREKANKQEEAVKRKRTVFVGNLPVSCTKKTLRSLFRDKGSIESIRFRSVVREDPTMSRKVAAIQRKIHPKKQSVNAYVVFKDDEGVAKALERNGLEIEKDFHIRVDRVADGSTQHDHKRSVFVGNLSFEISDLAFRRHFEDCGPVEAVRLVRDRDSGMGKGFGYVLFEGADSVQLALKLDGSKLEGRSVRVKRSVKKEKEKKNKTNSGGNNNNTGTAARAGRKGPAKGPAKGPGKSGGFKFPKKFAGNQPRPTKSSGSFKGEMVDPTKKTKKKLKRKPRPKKKSLHI